MTAIQKSILNRYINTQNNKLWDEVDETYSAVFWMTMTQRCLHSKFYFHLSSPRKKQISVRNCGFGLDVCCVVCVILQLFLLFSRKLSSLLHLCITFILGPDLNQSDICESLNIFSIHDFHSILFCTNKIVLIR